jgi:hypothetical protein
VKLNLEKMSFLTPFLAGVVIVGTTSYTVYRTIQHDTQHIQHRLMIIQRQLYGLPVVRNQYKTVGEESTEMALQAVEGATTEASQYVSKWMTLVSRQIHDKQAEWNKGLLGAADKANKWISSRGD